MDKVIREKREREYKVMKERKGIEGSCGRQPRGRPRAEAEDEDAGGAAEASGRQEGRLGAGAGASAAHRSEGNLVFRFFDSPSLLGEGARG